MSFLASDALQEICSAAWWRYMYTFVRCYCLDVNYRQEPAVVHAVLRSLFDAASTFHPGWAASVIYNATARAQFEAFRQRDDTFSLGICNGCQLMALLGWVAPDDQKTVQDGNISQGVLLSHNLSGRFESRFVSMGIQESPSIMLQGMAGSILGVWVAHGEGLMQFRNEKILNDVVSHNLAPLRYTDDYGKPTQEYPMNPNGSPMGIAGLCSDNGRHLAMMPHPERCVLTWQWPWMPEDWRQSLTVSPWMRMFQNAHDWCLKSRDGSQ